MKSRQASSVLRSLQRAIEAHVYRQVVRDGLNRLRYRTRAPLSAMPIYPRPRDITHSYAWQNYPRAHGATLIHIARDGTCLRSGGGSHRFAVAHIRELPEMPAQLGVIHPKALEAGHLEKLRKSSLRPSTS